MELGWTDGVWMDRRCFADGRSSLVGLLDCSMEQQRQQTVLIL